MNLLDFPKETVELIFSPEFMDPVDYEVLKYVNKQLCQIAAPHFVPEICVCQFAASAGYLEVLKWARSLDYFWDHSVYADAVRGGYLDVVIWAYSMNCPGKSIICGAACTYGQLDVVKWAHANGVSTVSLSYEKAATNGHLNILEWINDNDVIDKRKIESIAINQEHIHILEWLAKLTGHKWSYCHDYAVERPASLTWLLKHSGAKPTSNTTFKAARFGNLECIKILHKAGCAWDQRVYFAAYYQHNLDIIEYAYENGCPYNQLVVDVLLSGHNRGIATWARSVDWTV